MQTKQVSTKKVYFLITIVMAIFATLILTSCLGKTVVEKRAINVPQTLYVDEFDPQLNNIREAINSSGISIQVTYDDGTKEEVHLSFDMLDDNSKQQINRGGRHRVSCTYNGEVVEFSLVVERAITYKVRFFNHNNVLISEQTVRSGESAVEPSANQKAVDGFSFVRWDKSLDNITSDTNIRGIYEKHYVVCFYNGKNVLIDKQYVIQNRSATSPSQDAVAMIGYVFSHWDTDFSYIQSDKNVYGVYAIDEVTDTDGDGLTDYVEVEQVGLDHTKVDTDNDGISDAYEDTDNDGLTNITEVTSFLKPHVADTDEDGLTDGDEVNVYFTLPAVHDTDGDGAGDGWEIDNDFPPLEYNDSFQIEVSIPMSNGTNVNVDIPELAGEFVEQVIVESSKDDAMKDIHGSIGEAIKYNVSASANITISSEELVNAEDPVLMHFDPVTNQVAPIEVTINENEATASITTYGSYVLVDRKVFESKGQWRDVFMNGSFSSLEIVLVIDDSGSMSSNDSYDVRLDVAMDLIDSMPDAAKIGIVRFDDYATALTSSLTTSKDDAKSYLSSYYFDSNGLTWLYSGAMTALDLYSNYQANDGVFRVMVLLSDGYPEGEDPYTQYEVISAANANGVNIYTVGLGSNSSYFDNTLKPLSEGTNGEYQHSSNASALQAIYDKIGERIDMELDSDNDGIADFFESGVDKEGVPTLPTINGMDFVGLDKNDPDTDDDGYYDGQEIEIYTYYSDQNPNQVMVWGIVNSNPLDSSSIPANK